MAARLLCSPLSLLCAQPPAQFQDLFNGKDLTGWVNINTAPDTWTMRDGLLVNTGKPIGVMCSEKMYENFVLHVEWMHLEPGGNSGVFVWSDADPRPDDRLPDGVEVQMLELDWPKLNTRNGVVPPIAYVHGEVWGVGDVKTVPDNPRGERSKSIENRAKGRGEWNVYDVVAVDGVIKLSVNGKFVNGISRSTRKKGYLCLEAEGAEIHFRNMRILELPPGVTTTEQTAPERRGDAHAPTPSRPSPREHLVPHGAELRARRPLRIALGVGDAIADGNQQGAVFGGAGQVPPVFDLVGGLVIGLGRVLVALLLAVAGGLADKIDARIGIERRHARPSRN